jgi:hypothetical protein
MAHTARDRVVSVVEVAHPFANARASRNGASRMRRTSRICGISGRANSDIASQRSGCARTGTYRKPGRRPWRAVSDARIRTLRSGRRGAPGPARQVTRWAASGREILGSVLRHVGVIDAQPEPSDRSIHHGGAAISYRRDILTSGSRAVCRSCATWLPNEVPASGCRRGVARKRRECRTLKSDMPTSVLGSVEGRER